MSVEWYAVSLMDELLSDLDNTLSLRCCMLLLMKSGNPNERRLTEQECEDAARLLSELDARAKRTRITGSTPFPAREGQCPFGSPANEFGNENGRGLDFSPVSIGCFPDSTKPLRSEENCRDADRDGPKGHTLRAMK
jgi:hypothetical protein